MPKDVKLGVVIWLDHISGPECDEETVLDAFAAAIGRDNTAKPPLRITTGDPFDESVYEVALVDA